MGGFPGAAVPFPGYVPGMAWIPVHDNMGSGRFRAQTVPEILDSAFSMYRKNFVLMMAITTVLFLPWLVLTDIVNYHYLQPFAQASQGGRPLTQADANNALNGAFTAFGLAAVIAAVSALIITPITQAAMTFAVSNAFLDRPVTLGGAVSAVFRRLRSVLMLGLYFLLVPLLVGGAGVLVFFLAVLVAGPLALLVVLLGGFGFFVAWLAVYPRVVLAPAPLMIENTTGRSSLVRSWQLTRGSWGRCIGLVLLIGIISIILTLILEAIPVAFGFTSQTVNYAVSGFISLVMQPLSLIASTLLYYDLRIRKESFDVEMLASSL